MRGSLTLRETLYGAPTLQEALTLWGPILNPIFKYMSRSFDLNMSAMFQISYIILVYILLGLLVGRPSYTTENIFFNSRWFAVEKLYSHNEYCTLSTTIYINNYYIESLHLYSINFYALVYEFIWHPLILYSVIIHTLQCNLSPCPILPFNILFKKNFNK